jgi:hypothetical protein
MQPYLAMPAVRAAVALGALIGMTAGDAGSGGAAAQGRLEAQYTVTLAGIPFGTGTWQVDVREDQFNASMSGSTGGLLQLFSGGSLSTVARGSVSRGNLSGAAYASTIFYGKRQDDVRIAMSNGTVKEIVAEPPTMPTPERVPLSDAHRRNVTDPLTGLIIPVPGSGDVFAPETCQRKLAVFDGRMRYDLQLSFKRLEKVRSEKGYQGNVVVCAIYFTPVAGHVPQRSAIRYLVSLRDMEVWLAPIAGTRLMVPYRVSIPTPFGLGVMQATQFMSVPLPARAATTGSKPQ